MDAEAAVLRMVLNSSKGLCGDGSGYRIGAIVIADTDAVRRCIANGWLTKNQEHRYVTTKRGRTHLNRFPEPAKHLFISQPDPRYGVVQRKEAQS